MSKHEDYYEDFYMDFKKILLNSVKCKMVLTLSGGLDTRVLAGMLVESGLKLPVITLSNQRLEALVASIVAHKLGLKIFGYFCYGDIRSFYNIITEFGFDYVLLSVGFDEVCGSWKGCHAKSSDQFNDAKQKYMSQLPPTFNNDHVAVAPFLLPETLNLLDKIPWQYVKAKQIQRWILKTKFKQLWRIPYYNSLLPNIFPFEFHSVANKFHKISWRSMLGHLQLRESLNITF